MATMKDMKVLQDRTGVQLQACKQVLDLAANDIDNAILILRERNMIPAVRKQEIIDAFRDKLEEDAENFLRITAETGELKSSYATNSVDEISDNYFAWTVVDWYSHEPVYKERRKLMTEQEVEELDERIKDIFDAAVELHLPEFIQ